MKLTPAQRRRDAAAVQRAIYRRALADLRRRLREIQAWRRAQLTRVRQSCARARRMLSKALKEYRKREMERIRREVAETRARLRKTCTDRRCAIIEKARTESEAVRKAMAERRKLERDLRDVDRSQRKRLDAAARRTYRLESDDEVRQNLPPELVPVFDRHKGRFRDSPKMSRTEAFLHWVEEHPDEVLFEQAQAAEAAAAREIAEMQKAERAMAKKLAKAGKTRAPEFTKAELELMRRVGIDPHAPRRKATAEEIAAVPF